MMAFEPDYLQDPETWFNVLKEHQATIAAQVSRIEELEMALRIIAGYEQCIDNLMGNVDIARKALNKEKKDD